MNFITEEIDRFIFVIRTRSVVWIAPLGFLIFALIGKLVLNGIYDNYIEQHGQDMFAPAVTTIYEKHFHRMNHLIFFGTLIIFFTAYKKNRKHY